MVIELQGLSMVFLSSMGICCLALCVNLGSEDCFIKRSNGATCFLSSPIVQTSYHRNIIFSTSINDDHILFNPPQTNADVIIKSTYFILQYISCMVELDEIAPSILAGIEIRMIDTYQLSVR